MVGPTADDSCIAWLQLSDIAYALPVPSWTLQAVEKAAPDAASLAAARRLARPGPWSDVGSTDTLVWGKCQGSGATPYQVSVDSTGPAYRCSCPSRKFPCKHALALMLQFVDGASGSGQVPEWAEAAAHRAAETAERSARERKPVDPEARARRIEDRRQLMSAGIEDFARWLTDLIRGGLAEAGRQPPSWWDRAAARLVDAQLPGLADRVRRAALELTVDSSARVGAGRQDPQAGNGSGLLAEIGRWWLAVCSWRRFDDLDDATRADLRVVLGWHQAADDVRSGDAITDDWVVLGAHRDEDDGVIAQQRTWLRGLRTGETVQILDFGVQGRPLPIARLAGSVLSVRLARYPGHPPRRALFAEEPEALPTTAGLGAGRTVASAYQELRARWKDNPWAERVPVVLHGAVGRTTATTSAPATGCLIDDDGAGIALTGDPLPLLAQTGGRPATIFGEVERGRFRPLSLELSGDRDHDAVDHDRIPAAAEVVSL